MNKLALFGLGTILLLVLVAIFAPFIATQDPAAINIEDALLPPSSQHFLGTDILGRDVFSRMIYATRIALSIGIIAVGIAAIIGVILGSISGYFGGKIDSVIMRLTDIMLCFPSFCLILSVVAVVGPSIFNIMAIITHEVNRILRYFWYKEA